MNLFVNTDALPKIAPSFMVYNVCTKERNESSARSWQQELCKILNIVYLLQMPRGLQFLTRHLSRRVILLKIDRFIAYFWTPAVKISFHSNILTIVHKTG